MSDLPGALKPGQLAAVITAAGRSSRMGSLKALLNWRGRTLLAHQVHTLLPCYQVVVVLGFSADILWPHVPQAPNVEVVLNPDFDRGRSSSLLAAAWALQPEVEAVLLVAVDQPLREEVIEALCAGFGPEALAAVPVYDGRRGHPVLLRSSLIPALRHVDTEPEGLRTLLRRLGPAVQEIPVTYPDVSWDLNSPADYARLI
jgi:molybdenum cofactor cytidylyltransferase